METTATIIILIIAAMVLFLLEIVTPFFGILAAMAVGSLVAAIWLTFTISSVAGLIFIVAVVFFIPAYLTIVVRLLPRSPLGRLLFLGKARRATGDGTPEASTYAALVGKEGVTETVLRPTGAVRVEGKRVIGSAESGMIGKGRRVRVLRASGMNIVVRQIDEAG